MAQINITRNGVALGVGVADEVLERMALPPIGPLNAQTAARLLAVLAGLGLQVWGPQSRMALDVSESLSIAATPLLVKTVAQQLMPAATAGTRVAFTPRRMSGARAEDWAPSGGRSQYRPAT